ncbi:MAG: DEAD/DEAH box helicase [Timaviella obliquedivisa GSE-PSE-MK23-08B]|jgi:ATP-dependent RNA helicase RhlE|nr:DEAD/DEAH box helicase [Timaviella obliquedivisa GSE-PSE-MK23-08B]
MEFSDLGLSTDLLRAVAEQGYTEPTPIQQQAIPAVLAGNDVFASAQTGTGKTAGFTLPMLQLLSATPPHKVQRTPRALILTPTRELAAQIGDSVKIYGKHLSLRSAVVYGGVGIVPQIQALRRGVDIVVATPGRLLDHLGQRTLDLSQIEILVLDECDRMLDMGFIHDIRKVLAALPQSRQTLMFSATFSKVIQQLANTLLRDPTLIEVAARNTAAERVEQVVHLVDRDRKRELLAYMISFHNWQQVLVFTRTKHGANRLAEQLSQDGLKAAAIHGNKTQAARTRALNDFKLGKVRVLVATDVASRGIDIDQLPHVVNFELPHVPEDYVHRIGRTGRAGYGGKAVSLVSGEENPLLKGIEMLLNQTLAKIVVPGYEPKSSAQAQPEPEKRQRSNQGRGGQGARSNSQAAPKPQSSKSQSSKPQDPPTRSKKPVSASRARKRLRSA